MEDQPHDEVLGFAIGERAFWCVSSVEAYRLIAVTWPGEGSVVWELGAATGVATALAARRARVVHAVEKAPEKLAKLRELAEREPRVHVVEADALKAVTHGEAADLLLVDLGGDAPPWRTLEVAERWAEALHCEKVVVRNTKSWAIVRAMRAEPPPSLGLEGVAEGDDPVLLAHRASRTPDLAARLVAALQTEGFRDRKRTVEALALLGTAALQPLAGLIGDREAPLKARKSAAAALRQVVQASEQELQALQRTQSVPIRAAMGEKVAEEAARQGDLLGLLGHPDEFVRQLARAHLRKAGTRAARALVGEMARADPAAIVAGLDAIQATDAAIAVEVMEWATADGVAGLPDAIADVTDGKWRRELAAALREGEGGGCAGLR